MEVRSSWCAVVVGAVGVSGSAWGGLTYQTQDRSISATTTADGASQTISSPDFARFLATIDLATTFQTPGGGTGKNNAHAGIDCQLDPNALVINGALFGAGGLSAGNGSPKLELGEASAAVSTTFHLDFASPFSLFASARPSTRAGDRFKIKLKNETSGEILASIDQNSPPTELNLAGGWRRGTTRWNTRSSSAWRATR